MGEEGEGEAADREGGLLLLLLLLLLEVVEMAGTEQDLVK